MLFRKKETETVKKKKKWKIKNALRTKLKQTCFFNLYMYIKPKKQNKTKHEQFVFVVSCYFEERFRARIANVEYFIFLLVLLLLLLFVIIDNKGSNDEEEEEAVGNFAEISLSGFRFGSEGISK